jgi:histidinol-phosphatase
LSSPIHFLHLLAAAERWAAEAGAVTLKHYGSVVRHEEKADGSPVTRADREAELLLRTRILADYPDHSILGEELDSVTGSSAFRWILDPIDGTRSFMRGVPLYGVLIGVEFEGAPVIGVAHFPALGETVSAARGQGCRWNGRPCRVSETKDLRAAVALTSDPGMTRTGPIGEGWLHLEERVAYTRSWGDAYGHALVATGRADIMVDPLLSPWDSAPLLTLLTEAGGRFTSLDGEATHLGGSGVSSNGHLHEQVLALLAAKS